MLLTDALKEVILGLCLLNAFILPPLCFSTNALKILKASQAYDFFFRKYTQTFLLSSSIKEIKYSQPPGGISTEQKSE